MRTPQVILPCLATVTLLFLTLGVSILYSGISMRLSRAISKDWCCLEYLFTQSAITESKTRTLSPSVISVRRSLTAIINN